LKFGVRITRAAHLDLDAITGYLLQQEGQEIALRQLDMLIDSVTSLSNLPDRGSHPREFLTLGIQDFRQLIQGPYRIIYRIKGRTVDVVAILDGRRDIRTLLERRFLLG